MKPSTYPLFARLTVRKTVHFVMTLEVYGAPTAPPPKPVIETMGVEVRDSELPPSVPGLRTAQPVGLHLVRKSA